MGNTRDVDNQLIARMSPSDRTLLLQSGTVVELDRGTELGLPGGLIEWCWFPANGLISIIAMDANGGEAEVGVIGRDGLVNAAIVVGETINPTRVLVQIGGSALKVEVVVLRQLLAESPGLAATIQLYLYAFSLQIAASAHAFARYMVVQRLARSLLMCGDRVGDAHIPLTHKMLSVMLGVRRAGVSVAFQHLGDAIGASRGSLAIVDRPALLRAAGACYGTAEAHYERLLRTELEII